LIAAWLAHALLGPLRRVDRRGTPVCRRQLRRQGAERTSDEIGQLCIAFNGMVDEIHAKNDIIETKNRENEEAAAERAARADRQPPARGEQSIADGFAEVTVAFADLVGFTALLLGDAAART